MDSAFKKYFASTDCRIAEPLKRLFRNRTIVGAEIGVWRGSNARELLSALKHLTLVGVDMWDLHAVRKNRYYYTNSPNKIPPKFASRKYGLNCFQKAKEAVSPFSNRCTLMRASSKEASQVYTNGFFDFVYIDACHKYEACKEDILLWMPKIKIGGYLCGHDYNSSHNVRKAVLEVKLSTDLDFAHNKNRFGEWIMGPIKKESLEMRR